MRLPWSKAGGPGQPGAQAPAGQVVQPGAQQPQGVVQQPAAPQEAAMEAKVSSRGGTPQPGSHAGKRVGRWSIDQLRQTDGIIPLQNGTNRFASQKSGVGASGATFGTPRNTSLKLKQDNLQEIPEEIARLCHLEVRPQSGTNRFASQRGMVGMGTGRDVCRESNKVNILPGDLQPLPEEKELLTHGIVRLQSGTNRYASQKGGVGYGTGMGTNRRETTKMLDSKHPEQDIEHPDQKDIPLQSGTNKFASQKGGVGASGAGFGTARRETTRMLDNKHPDDSVEHPDQGTIPSQMGTNKFASQAGFLGSHCGAFRPETLDPITSRQRQEGQGLIPSQMGSNQFASQAGFGMSSFGMPRDVPQHNIEGGDLPFEEFKTTETIIPSQAGWNRGDSQKGYTSFGAPRDVKGKHLKRLWELEYPEETVGHIL